MTSFWKIVVVHNGILKTKEQLEENYNPVKEALWTQIIKHKVFYIMLVPCLRILLNLLLLANGWFGSGL